MSDLMLKAILKMPLEMAISNELSKHQYYNRAQQVLAEIDRLDLSLYGVRKLHKAKFFKAIEVKHSAFMKFNRDELLSFYQNCQTAIMMYECLKIHEELSDGDRDNPCVNCGKPSFFLCDYILGWAQDSKDKSLATLQKPPYSCDAPLCRECAIHGGSIHYKMGSKGHTDSFDFCPLHKESNPLPKPIDESTAKTMRSEVMAHFQRKKMHLVTKSESFVKSFQNRVQEWMKTTFGEAISNDVTERNHRFLEEALDLVQACGCTASEAHQLVDYVFSRPVGEKVQEVGGVVVTLNALCSAQDIDVEDAGETELARIWTKVEEIRAKQAAKPKHSPLPM